MLWELPGGTSEAAWEWEGLEGNASDSCTLAGFPQECNLRQRLVYKEFIWEVIQESMGKKITMR